MNLHRSKAALDLLKQTARERKADILFFSEQCKKPDLSIWYQDSAGRAGIQILNPKLQIGQFQETDSGHVWVEVQGMRIYSCYFSPNDHLNKLEAEIQDLEDSVRSTRKDVFMTGDFNSKSPQWGETRLDKRGTIVEEMVARSDLTVVNAGQVFTFTRGDSGSIIDLKIATAGVARRISDWNVLDKETLSDHRYIEFSIDRTSK